MPAALAGESRACIARGDRIGRPAFVAPEFADQLWV